MRDAAGRVVRHRAAELVLRDLLVRHRLDHVGAGHEHVARALDHDVEVGDRRRIDRAAGARAHDRGDLRHHAGRQRVAQEDVGVAAERQHAFLDARAARVVEADDRRAHLHREIHDLHDLRGVGLRQRAAEDGEVLREGVDRAAVDAAGAGDDAVAGNRRRLVHPEVAAAVRDELVGLLERAGIEQEVDALARRQLAGVVLLLEAVFAAAELGAALEILEMFDRIHVMPDLRSGLRVAGLGLLPVRQELLQPDVGQRMIEQRVDHRRRAGADVGAHARRLDDVHRAARAGDEDLGLEVVVAVDLDDVANQLHAGRRDVVEPADERADVGRADLGGEQRLRRREAQRDVDLDAFARQRLAGLDAVARERHLDDDVRIDLRRARGPRLIIASRLGRDDLGAGRALARSGRSSSGSRGSRPAPSRAATGWW